MRQIGDLGKCLLLCLMALGPNDLSAARGLEAPELTAVVPKTGATTPGIRVLVYGTGFLPDTIVYFGGLEVRETKFISASTLEVVTPYLRPGTYQLQLRSGATTVKSEVTFLALPSRFDFEIDRAVALARKGETAAAISLLTSIANTSGDYQARAFAHYRAAQIYFAQGDWWHWAGEAAGVYDDADKSGRAVQTSWQYRLSYAQSTYILPIDGDADTPLKLANWTVEYDVTKNPEPQFFRGLLNARYGDFQKAKIDSDSILSIDPGNPSYRALAAYIAVLAGEKAQLQSFSGEPTKDARALSLLGETAYLSGDLEGAQRWWVSAAKEYPLGAGLACWAGRKHLARGQKRVAAALLNQCITMAPNSKEAKEAIDLLAKSQEARSKE